jgi:phosphatidylserine/phosphatidylglycerophosphate/cardiolipin synthase-like enzyme
VSVTFGGHEPSGTPKCEQIKHLYEDAIARAERLIYIETQYFTSHAVHDALCRRMREGDGALEIVVVMPRGADTSKEKFALGAAQRWILSSLRATAREHGHALRVLCSVTGDEHGAQVPTFIHSKLLTVDDRLLTIGSANVTNRSMSLDTELNVVWECAADGDGVSHSIARLRANLLSEHAGIELDPGLGLSRGLCARIDELVGSTKLRLSCIPDSPAEVERSPLLERAFDPDAALDELGLDELIEPKRD